MHRQATCNLLTTLSYPPWTKDVDRDVYMTSGGEERVPFYLYVRASGSTRIALQHSPTLLAFTQLPDEILLHIHTKCSPSTLFQLMHTSSKLRIEASKLFWGNRHAYFLVEAEWLLEGAYPGQSFWDMAFFANVRNVEVECHAGISRQICIQRDDTLDIQSDLIRLFWASLQDRFPNMRKIVLNYNESSLTHPYAGGPFSLALQLLLQACPYGIEASVLFLEKKPIPEHLARAADWRTATWQRCLFNPTDNAGWHKCAPDNLRITIMIPPKRFNGPVGRYSELSYQSSTKLRLQRFGFWPLVVEAIDRHHFDMGRHEPFSCPFSGCAAYFSQAGEWAVHAAEAHYNKEGQSLLEVLPNSNVGANIRERSQRLDKKRKEAQEQYKEMIHVWGTEDDAAQAQMKRSWVEQLNRDAAWETKEKGEKSILWRRFMDNIYNVY